MVLFLGFSLLLPIIKMKDKRVERVSDILVDFCAEVRVGEEVLISGPVLSLPLIKEIYRKILVRGAHPHVRLNSSELSEIFYRNANEEQLRFISSIEKGQARKVDKRILVIAPENTKTLANVSSNKQLIVRESRKVLKDLYEKKAKGVVTTFPTQAHAQEAGMSFAEFEDFVFGTMFADKRSPIKRWAKLRDRHFEIIESLEGARELKIISRDTELTLSVEGRKFCSAHGMRNMPSGEIYTGPVEESLEGHIKFDFPVIESGRDIEDVELKFKNGKVVDVKATKNKKFLTQILAVDQWSKYVGELGIGTNPAIRRYTRNMLFDEKMIGTLHIALGCSYPETLGKNKSSVHLDMIKDMTRDGEVYVDGDLFQTKGKFLV